MHPVLRRFFELWKDWMLWTLGASLAPFLGEAIIVFSMSGGNVEAVSPAQLLGRGQLHIVTLVNVVALMRQSATIGGSLLAVTIVLLLCGAFAYAGVSMGPMGPKVVVTTSLLVYGIMILVGTAVQVAVARRATSGVEGLR